MGFAPTWLRQVSPLASHDHFNHCRQVIVWRVCGVNYYLNSNHAKYLAQTLPLISHVLDKFHRKFANLSSE